MLPVPASGDQALAACMALLAAGVPLTLLIDLADVDFPAAMAAELLGGGLADPVPA